MESSIIETQDRYFPELVTAFVRGRLGDPTATVADGIRAGLRLHKFKRNATLPRVRRVLGILSGMAPTSLLDVGCGRGTFLWPLLDQFPALAVTTIDWSVRRTMDAAATRRGGVERLRVARMDAQRLGFAPRSFDVVTILEVLEHVHDPSAALREAMACARRFLIASVPSVPDHNPEHLRLFRVADLQQLAAAAGCLRVAFESVLNHRIMLCRTS